MLWYLWTTDQSVHPFLLPPDVLLCLLLHTVQQGSSITFIRVNSFPWVDGQEHSYIWFVHCTINSQTDIVFDKSRIISNLEYIEILLMLIPWWFSSVLCPTTNTLCSENLGGQIYPRWDEFGLLATYWGTLRYKLNTQQLRQLKFTIDTCKNNIC
jgi:hypothetical protein